MNRRQFSTLLVGSGAAGLCVARTNWRLATGYRRESFHTVNLMAMALDAGAATQGELQIEIHPNNTMVKLNDMRAAVERGEVEAGETIMSSLVGEIPIAGADSVPFIVGSYADARRMWRHQRPLIERHFAQRGLRVLYAVPWPPQGLYSSKPIASAADLKGSRMRTYNATTARIAALVGAQGIDVTMVEVGQALADGRIDSMITSAVTGVENKVWSHLKYYYEVNAWFPKNIVFANLNALNALEPRLRDGLLKASAAAEVRGWAASEAAAASSVEELRRNGMKVERVAREFALEIKRLGERFSLEWIRQVGNEANDIFVPYFTLA
ncbi:TRAP transporter substrate-binding protein [Piscinibacter sp.]|jgi:TRAP-type C4-dicarboxylate transport system substrate-binding protein|uniref:TRAP transporter substrate-binding protein n=1 Tax=Piscinibacter sp. TaxID=1903157 RepID=UPI002F407017